MFINKYPYTCFHDMNLDWLIREMKELEIRINNFELTNQIHYEGVWDISKAYQKYSLVVYDNVGYISVDAVPDGVNITNTDYWVRVANFTAEIADIGNRVIALEDNYEDISTDIENINGLLTTFDKKLNSDSKCILIGNSYAYGTGANGKGWAYWLKEHTGLTEVAHAYQNGGDFIARGNANATYPNLTYLQACQSITSTLTEDERNSIDFIIFGGGYNDYTDNIESLPSSATIRNAIYDVIDYLKPLYPNAKIVLIPLAPATYKSASAVNDGYSFDHIKKYISAWVRGASGRGCLSCANTNQWFSNRSTYASGNIHLNENGYNLCAYYMEAVINGWDGSLVYDLDHTMIFTDAVTSHSYEDSGTGNEFSTIHIWSENGITHIKGHFAYELSSAVSTSNQPELLSFDTVFAPKQGAEYVPCFVYTTNTRVLGLLRITVNGSIGLRYLSNTEYPLSGEIYIFTSFPS